MTMDIMGRSSRQGTRSVVLRGRSVVAQPVSARKAAVGIGSPVRTAEQAEFHCRASRLLARQAWTLIEMVGVLAVLALLAAMLLPALVKQTDKAVADQEKATLKSLADAFQQYVLDTRVVPDQTTWYAAVASETGLGTNDILYNVRQQSHQQQRVFLIDPALQVGNISAPTTSLPYSQTNFLSSNPGSPMLPQNLRLMIVSSLGQSLPKAVASGTFGDTSGKPYFTNLWSAADGTLPADGAWSGWSGKPADVVVQRLDLQPLFVHLYANKYNSPNGGAYAIDGDAPVAVANVDAYFIRGSVLTLYNGLSPSVLDNQQILTQAASFILENGVWRGSLSGSTMNAGIMNIGDVVQQFLRAPPNFNAANQPGNLQQVLVASNMLSFMSNYSNWAEGGFKDANLQTKLNGIQAAMMVSIQGLYRATANLPLNTSPCQQ